MAYRSQLNRLAYSWRTRWTSSTIGSGHMLLTSAQRDEASSEVDTHNLPTEEIQAEKTVDTRAWRKRVSEHRKLIALLPQCADSSNRNTGSELDSTAYSNLYPIGSQRGVVSDGRQRRHIHHSPRGPGIQRETQDDAPRRAKHLGLNGNEAMFRVERMAHRTTAVSSGIWPV